MDGFYVFGGGMGHLSRVRKFIDFKNIADFKIITGNPLANRFFDTGNLLLFRQKSSNVKSDLISFLKAEVSLLPFINFYVDCFPAGILYELEKSFINCKELHYFTRRVKPDSYQFDRVKLQYDSCIALEELSLEQISFVRKQSLKVVDLKLPTPKPETNRIPKEFINSSTPLWLVVHSSDKDEIGLLVMKANQLAELEKVKPQLILISDNNFKSEGVKCLNNEMNPINYFDISDRIFTGAGFNIIHELQGYEHKHVCLPFERKYDDQKWRIKENRNRN